MVGVSKASTGQKAEELSLSLSYFTLFLYLFLIVLRLAGNDRFCSAVASLEHLRKVCFS